MPARSSLPPGLALPPSLRSLLLSPLLPFFSPPFPPLPIAPLELDAGGSGGAADDAQEAVAESLPPPDEHSCRPPRRTWQPLLPSASPDMAKSAAHSGPFMYSVNEQPDTFRVSYSDAVPNRK